MTRCCDKAARLGCPAARTASGQECVKRPLELAVKLTMSAGFMLFPFSKEYWAHLQMPLQVTLK